MLEYRFGVLFYERQIYSRKDVIRTGYNIIVDVEILEGSSKVYIKLMWND